MIFLADENIEREVIERLLKDGHNITRISEIQAGMLDDDVLEHARREQTILLTNDKDFGALVFQQRKLSFGVLLIRLPTCKAGKKADIIALVIQQLGQQFPGAFAVVTEDEVRIRKLPD